MNVVSIVTHSRPWLLKLNLEQLMVQPEVNNYRYMFFTETGFHPDVTKVIKWFSKETGTPVSVNINNEIKSPLQAFTNIMTSYEKASLVADEYVIVLEEDIIPTQDYLRFNHTVYKKFLSKFDRLFCVAHKRRPETELKGQSQWLIGDYQITSPSCVSVKTIKNHIVPWFSKRNFWTNPILFNYEFFPKHRNPPNHHIHHDGQIERMADHVKMFSLKPDQARSMHLGIGGINCKGIIGGTTEEKYRFFKEIIWNQDGEKLRELADNFKRDMCVTDPKGPEWTDLFLDTTRSMVTGSSWSFDPDNELEITS